MQYDSLYLFGKEYPTKRSITGPGKDRIATSPILQKTEIAVEAISV